VGSGGRTKGPGKFHPEETKASAVGLRDEEKQVEKEGI